MDETSSILLSGRSEACEAAKTLILAASQRVYIYSQRLESDLYNDVEIYNHLSQLASENRKSDFRIIAHDTRVAANRGHYLIHLAQKLPSFAQIRTTVTPAQRQFKESWLLVDDGALLRLRNLERYEGYYELDNKLENRSYTAEFLEAWEACQGDQNTRRLSL